LDAPDIDSVAEQLRKLLVEVVDPVARKRKERKLAAAARKHAAAQDEEDDGDDESDSEQQLNLGYHASAEYSQGEYDDEFSQVRLARAHMVA
jgi:uncharacterized membrane protein